MRKASGGCRNLSARWCWGTALRGGRVTENSDSSIERVRSYLLELATILVLLLLRT